jgi:hypothetical protein
MDGVHVKPWLSGGGSHRHLSIFSSDFIPLNHDLLLYMPPSW